VIATGLPRGFDGEASKLPPLYKAHGETYQADTCRMVVQAVEAGEIAYRALSRGQYFGRSLPRNALSGLCLLGFWDAKRDQRWGLDWHRNEGVEITFLESGSLLYACDDETHALKAGDLTVARPWQPHRLGDPDVRASRLHFLIFDLGVRRPHQTWTWPPWVLLTETDRRELSRMIRHTEQVVWPTTADVRSCFQRIARAVETDRSGSRVSLLGAYLNELLVWMLEMFRQGEPRLDESLASACRTVELFWSELSRSVDQLGEPWTLRNMARRCGLGVPQFVHYCRQLYNTSPMKHLSHCRLKQAARLLAEEPQRTVTDIGLALGFSSSQYFATVFRGQMGCSPLAFRATTGMGESMDK